MIKDYKFDGWDFAELFECFEIPYGKDQPEPPLERRDECELYAAIAEHPDKIETCTTSVDDLFAKLGINREEARAMAEKHIQEEKEYVDTLRKFIRSHSFNFHSSGFQEVPEESREVHKKCVEFLDALIKLSKKWSYVQPLWKGLRKIKDQGTFLDMFAHLVDHMWV
jgi:hypothetical protein